MGIKDPKLANELKRQQAIAKRGLGKFEDSFNDLVELLKLTPNAWHIQIDAAKTLQVWGVQKHQSEQLAKALSGAEKYRDPKTKRQKLLVWGWARLADILRSQSQIQRTVLSVAVRGNRNATGIRADRTKPKSNWCGLEENDNNKIKRCPIRWTGLEVEIR